MKKKLTLFCVLLVFVSSFTFSSDYKFLFGAIGMHEDQLGGIGPTYLNLGIGQTDITLIEDNTTEIQYYLGGGTEKRTMWNSTTDGSNGVNDVTLDLIRVDWKARLNQGFFDDVLTASVAYDGIYEYFKSGAEIDNSYYPDLESDNNLGTYFTGDLKLNFMVDDMFVQDGFLADAEFTYAPLALNSIFGMSDFYSANLELNFAKTLHVSKAYDTGRNLFSLVLVDRVVANYTDGDCVPTYFRKEISLGRKVRGFSSYSYNNKLTFVNNLDFRISVYELDEIKFARIFPRFNFFVDVGYGMLEYVNTSKEENNLIASTGVQATICVSDFASIGYQFAYILKGENYATESSTNGSLVLMLDF
ncbi:MAG: hypothetical protein ACPKM0_09535 [Pleomorphochaeta sp.]